MVLASAWVAVRLRADLGVRAVLVAKDSGMTQGDIASSIYPNDQFLLALLMDEDLRLSAFSVRRGRPEGFGPLSPLYGLGSLKDDIGLSRHPRF